MVLVRICVQNKKNSPFPVHLPPPKTYLQHTYDQSVSILIKFHCHFRTLIIKLKPKSNLFPKKNGLGIWEARESHPPQHNPAVPGAPAEQEGAETSPRAEPEIQEPSSTSASELGERTAGSALLGCDEQVILFEF